MQHYNNHTYVHGGQVPYPKQLDAHLLSQVFSNEQPVRDHALIAALLLASWITHTKGVRFLGQYLKQDCPSWKTSHLLPKVKIGFFLTTNVKDGNQVCPKMHFSSAEVNMRLQQSLRQSFPNLSCPKLTNVNAEFM